MSKFQVSPFINFQGKAREALEFYKKALGGTLDLQTLRLEVGDVYIIATDGHPDYPAKVGENMALAISGTDRDRLTKAFNGLAEGGKIKAPLAAQSWGGEMGYFVDKFGINWMVTIDKA